MMYTIARYYSTSEHMSRLFNKLTNQMILRCKEQITANGKLWDQDKPTLLVNMKGAVELAKVYREHYKLAKEQLAQNPESKQFQFDEQVRASELFSCSRVLDATIHHAAKGTL